MCRDCNVPNVSGQVEDFQTPVSANLIAEMSRTGMTVSQVASALGVAERQVTRWRGGQEPRSKFVARLAELFEREAGWFYTDHSEQVAA